MSDLSERIRKFAAQKKNAWCENADSPFDYYYEVGDILPLIEALVECAELVRRLDITLQGHEEGRWTRDTLARLELLVGGE